LLAGLLLLGQVADTLELSALLQRGDVVRAHPAYLPILLLVLAGAFTKSTQVAVYSLATMDAGREAFGYYPLLHLLLMGVSAAFLTGDVFNLYVAFEVMPMASFVLMALGGERAQLEGAIKYVTLNLVSSAIFLTAVGVLYGTAGSLNMADLSQRLKGDVSPAVVTALAMLFLAAFGIKAAVFPLFFWLPASYHTPPAAVSAVFAGLLTKVGVYALIRVFTLLFTHDVAFTHGLCWPWDSCSPPC
jgi:multicomponent Na+:H+ antiporter subunit D